MIGVVLAGAVQDFVILFCSIRRNGKSLAQMVKEELNSSAGSSRWSRCWRFLVILLAVLALVVVRALAESPWACSPYGATIPIALLMGGYMRFVRVGESVGSVGLRHHAAVAGSHWGGKLVYQSTALVAGLWTARHHARVDLSLATA